MKKGFQISILDSLLSFGMAFEVFLTIRRNMFKENKDQFTFYLGKFWLG
jgi:hypothetical protein